MAKDYQTFNDEERTDNEPIKIHLINHYLSTSLWKKQVILTINTSLLLCATFCYLQTVFI